MQSISMTTGVQRQTEINPITIAFACINERLHSRVLLSRLREPATARAAFKPAIKDVVVFMREIMDVLSEGGFQKKFPKPVFVISPGYAHLPDGLKFAYAINTLLSEGLYDMIVPAPNRKVETSNLRPLQSKLQAFLSDILNAMRGLKEHLLRWLGESITLTRYPEQMWENIKKFDMKREIASWTKMRELRHTLIQYFRQQDRFNTGEDTTNESKEDV